MPTPNFVGTFTGTYQYVPGFGSGPAVPFTITIFGTSSSLSDDWQAGPYPNGYSGGGEGSGTPTGSDVILLDEDGETELNLTLSVDNNTLTGVEENPCPLDVHRRYRWRVALARLAIHADFLRLISNPPGRATDYCLMNPRHTV